VSRIVLDANLAFRALAAGRPDVSGRLDAPEDVEFFAPFFLLAELFEHKEQILEASKLSEADIVDAFHQFIETISFIREATIPLRTWLEAHRLCRDVDADDTPYVALTLHLDAKLWTYDVVLKAGLRAKGFDAFFEP
jgi:predicted nucleic acid-binding protein